MPTTLASAPAARRRARPTNTAVAPSATRLSAAALDVLATTTCTDDSARITAGQLPREIYEEVNEALNRLGGQWTGGKTGVHRFAYVDPATVIAAVVASGRMPEKNPTAFFPTPAALVHEMLDATPVPYAANMGAIRGRPLRALEPSGGVGGIANAVRALCPNAADLTLDVVEALDINAHVLRANGHTVYEQDFLTFTTDEPYDVILMNPPFSLHGAPLAYIDHVRHAVSLLSDRGVLVAIVPTAWMHARRDGRAVLRAFRDFVYEHGEATVNPDGSFRESGTTVATAMIVIDHANATRRDWDSRDAHCWHCWNLALELDNDHAKQCEIERLATRDRAARLTFIQRAADESDGHVVLIPACERHLLAAIWPASAIEADTGADTAPDTDGFFRDVDTIQPPRAAQPRPMMASTGTMAATTLPGMRTPTARAMQPSLFGD